MTKQELLKEKILFDLEKENKELKKQIEELKEDRGTVWETACEMVSYLEDTDYIEQAALDEYIATIQNFSN